MKKIKNIQLLWFTFIISLLLSSCSNIFTGADSQAGGNSSSAGSSVITFTGSVGLKGAVPSSVINSQGNGNPASTALPTLPAGNYHILVENKTDGTSINSTDNSDVITFAADYSSFTVPLAVGKTFDITVEYRDDSAIPVKVLMKSKVSDIAISVETPQASENFVMLPFSEGSGTAELDIEYPASVQCAQIEKVENLGTNTDVTAANLFTLTSSKITAGSISSGSYKVTLDFYSSSTPGIESRVYSISEVINIFDDLKTDKFVDSGGCSYISSGKIVITAAMLALWPNHELFVDPTLQALDSSQSNYTSQTGSWLNPYVNFLDALTAVNNSASGETYSIHLKKGSEIIASSKIEIKNSVNIDVYNESFGLESFYGATIKRAAGFTDTLLSVDSEKTVSISGFILDGNEVDVTGCPGGIHNKGTLNLSGSKVINFKSNFSGAGIYNEGTMTMEKNCVVSNNKIETTTADAAVYGAGIYNNGTMMISDAEISANEISGGYGGGGIYNTGKSSDELRIKNCKIVNNRATVNINGSEASGTSADLRGGAGIYSSTNKLFVTSGIIAGNIVEGGNGGAVYSKSGSLSLGLTANLGAAANLKIGAFESYAGNEARSSGSAGGMGGAVYCNTDSNAFYIYGDVLLGTEALAGSATSSSFGNKAVKGGAVYSTGNRTIYCNNGRLIGNYASEEGGGICFGNGAGKTCYLRGFMIKQNTSGNSRGNGVYSETSGIQIGGTSDGSSDDHKIYVSTDNEIYLESGKTISLGSKFNFYTGCSYIPLTAPDTSYSSNEQVLTGTNVETFYVKFKLIKPDYVIDSDGKIYSSPIIGMASAPASGTYNIGTEPELKLIGTWVNNGSSMTGVCFNLYKDIKLTTNWTRMNGTADFTLEGNNKTISGFQAKGTSDGFIKKLGDNGELNSIKFAGASNGGGIVSECRGKIDSCESNITISTTLSMVGAFAGKLSGSISNCVNKGSVTSTSSYIGGITGYCEGGSILRCGNYAAVTGGQSAGGITGFLENGSVELCMSSAEVKASATNGSMLYAGGIAGGAEGTAQILNCHAGGQITASNCAGGIAGYFNANDLEYCCYSGDIIDALNCGGIAGSVVSGTVLNVFYKVDTKDGSGNAVTLAVHDDGDSTELTYDSSGNLAKGNVSIGGTFYTLIDALNEGSGTTWKGSGAVVKLSWE